MKDGAIRETGMADVSFEEWWLSLRDEKTSQTKSDGNWIKLIFSAALELQASNLKLEPQVSTAVNLFAPLSPSHIHFSSVVLLKISGCVTNNPLAWRIIAPNSLAS